MIPRPRRLLPSNPPRRGRRSVRKSEFARPPRIGFAFRAPSGWPPEKWRRSSNRRERRPSKCGSSWSLTISATSNCAAPCPVPRGPRPRSRSSPAIWPPGCGSLTASSAGCGSERRVWCSTNPAANSNSRCPSRSHLARGDRGARMRLYRGGRCSQRRDDSFSTRRHEGTANGSIRRLRGFRRNGRKPPCGAGTEGSWDMAGPCMTCPRH